MRLSGADNIVLTGFMGTGKSEVGKVLARALGCAFVDVDAAIEKRSGMSISDIFETQGEAVFRRIESEVIGELSRRKRSVIATGGGAVVSADNRAALRAGGIIVCLTASVRTILHRVRGNADRPLLKGEHPEQRIQELLEARRPFYALADIMVATDGKRPEEIVDEIIERVALLSAERKKGQRVMKTIQKVAVKLGSRSYTISIGNGVLDRLGEQMVPFGFSRKIGVISNPTVFKLYGERVMQSLRSSGFEPFSILIPDGEKYKNLKSVETILTRLLEERLDRKACLVALGGGVIGDIAGFVASLYMRGISFVQVPTTLLSQVDSSVGGKTGVNHPLGKNMIGAFYQPRLVWIDTATLRTLPQRELLCGIAEVIKYGIIWDEAFFAFLEQQRLQLLGLDPAVLAEVVKISCSIKAQVVAKDEREGGLRAILNFGHTVGHAIETETSYSRFLHGEAVAIGMAAAARLAHRLKMLDKQSVMRIKTLIADYGLPTDIPEGMDPERLCAHMTIDKKAEAGRVTFVLPERIGSVRIVKDVDISKIKQVLS